MQESEFEAHRSRFHSGQPCLAQEDNVVSFSSAQGAILLSCGFFHYRFEEETLLKSLFFVFLFSHTKQYTVACDDRGGFFTTSYNYTTQHYYPHPVAVFVPLSRATRSATSSRRYSLDHSSPSPGVCAASLTWREHPGSATESF
jgi:hypothetical protein